MKIVKMVTLILFFTPIIAKANQTYEFKTQFAKSVNKDLSEVFQKVVGFDLSIYDVYCVHKATEDFCAVNALFIKEGCEIKTSEWDSGPEFYDVTFDPSDKSFIIHSTLGNSKKKLKYIITKGKLKMFDGDSHVTMLPKTEKISFTCNDAKYITHLRHMIDKQKSSE